MTRELLTKVACCEFDVQVQLKKDFSTDVCGELEIIEDCRTVHLDSNMHGLSVDYVPYRLRHWFRCELHSSVSCHIGHHLASPGLLNG